MGPPIARIVAREWIGASREIGLKAFPQDRVRGATRLGMADGGAREQRALGFPPA